MSKAQIIEDVESQVISEAVKHSENNQSHNETEEGPATSDVPLSEREQILKSPCSGSDFENTRSYISLNGSDDSNKNVVVYGMIQQDESPSRYRRESSTRDINKDIDTIVDTKDQSCILQSQTEVVISSESVDEALEALDAITSSVAIQDDAFVESMSRVENAPAGVITQQPRSERDADAATEVRPSPSTFNQVIDQMPITQFQHVQPPSYTSVEIRRPSIAFVPPVPPPSYGEAMGMEHLTSPRPPPLILNVAPSVWTHRAQPAYCRNCHAVVISKIRHKPCTFTHMAAGLLFLFMRKLKSELFLVMFRCWPFCVLPYCINYCQQTRHHCPGCNQILGTYNPVV